MRMTIIEVKERTITLINQLLEIWEDSVKATHLFLSNEEINNIKELEMLFIKNSERGKGLGKQLLNYGVENYNVNEVAVNEQNYI